MTLASRRDPGGRHHRLRRADADGDAVTRPRRCSTSTTYTVTLSGAEDAAGNQMDPVTWTFTTAASASGLPVLHLADSTVPATPRHRRLLRRRGRRQVPDESGRATSPASGSTRGPGTRAPTPARCGPAPAPSSRRCPSPARPRPAGRQATFGGAASRSPPTRPTSPPTTHPWVGTRATAATSRSAATTRGPLTALRNGTDGGNGVYRYGASGFPNSTYQSTNYWVDVVFDTTRPTRPRPPWSRRRRRPTGRASRPSSTHCVGHLLRDRRRPAPSPWSCAGRPTRAPVTGTVGLRRRRRRRRR